MIMDEIIMPAYQFLTYLLFSIFPSLGISNFSWYIHLSAEIHFVLCVAGWKPMSRRGCTRPTCTGTRPLSPGKGRASPSPVMLEGRICLRFRSTYMHKERIIKDGKIYRLEQIWKKAASSLTPSNNVTPLLPHSKHGPDSQCLLKFFFIWVEYDLKCCRWTGTRMESKSWCPTKTLSSSTTPKPWVLGSLWRQLTRGFTGRVKTKY